MTSSQPRPPADGPRVPVQSPTHTDGGHGGHGWMMIACCIPMLVIAVLLVATGAASIGFLGVAVACTATMALMMRGMDTGGPGHRDGR